MLDSFLLRRAISRISLGLSSNQEDGAGVEVITGCSSSDMVNDEQREITSMTALSPWLEETPRLMQEIPLGPASVSGLLIAFSFPFGSIGSCPASVSGLLRWNR